MKHKRLLKIFLYGLLMIFLIFPFSIARFSNSKKHSGTINVRNQLCEVFSGDAAEYILQREGGKEYINSKPKPDMGVNANTREGMFMAEDDCGKSYYYRGVADNWLSFAGFYWRIIRINGDGSIRMIYAGDKINGNSRYDIGNYPYNSNNTSINYVDYRLSQAKNIVDEWYKNNILEKGFSGKVADTGYCNDMSIDSSGNFGADNRLKKKTPSLRCPNKEDFLTQRSNALKYPVALITRDEASFAGATHFNSQEYNSVYFLNTPGWYWTMSPLSWDGNEAHVFFLGSGRIYQPPPYAVRPVLSLKSDVTLTSGDGTESNPFIVS